MLRLKIFYSKHPKNQNFCKIKFKKNLVAHQPTVQFGKYCIVFCRLGKQAHNTLAPYTGPKIKVIIVPFYVWNGLDDRGRSLPKRPTSYAVQSLSLSQKFRFSKNDKATSNPLHLTTS